MPVLVLVLVLINQYSDSYSCSNQVFVLVLTHITSTRTHTRKSCTRPSPDDKTVYSCLYRGIYRPLSETAGPGGQHR